MFCMKCGKPTEGDARLCPECAAAAMPQQPAEPVQPVQPVEPVQQPVQQPAFDLNLSAQAPAPKQKKPPKKGLAVWIIVGILALSLVGTGIWGLVSFGMQDFFSGIADTVSYWFFDLFHDDQEEAAYVEGRSLDALAKGNSLSASELGLIRHGATRLYGSFMNAMQRGTTGSSEATIHTQIGDPLLELLAESLPAMGADATEAAQLLEVLQNCEITVSGNNDGESAATNVGLSLNGTELLNVEVTMDPEDETLYIDLGEDFGDPLSLEIDDESLNTIAMITEMPAQMAEISKHLPSQEAFGEMLDKYILLALSQMEVSEKSTETVEVDGVKQRFTVLTYEISEETLVKMAIAILEEAEDDDQLHDVLEVFCQYINTLSQIMEENGYDGMPYTLEASDVIEQIPDILDQLEEYADDADDDAVVEIETYVNSRGYVSGRTVKVEDVGQVLSYITVSKGQKYAFEAKAGVGSDSVTLAGSGTQKNGLITGSYALKAMRQEALILELENFDQAAYTGTARLKLGKALVEQVEDSMPMSGLLDVSKLAVELELQSGSVDARLKMGNDLLFAIGGNASYGEATKVQAPDGAVDVMDEEDMLQWLEGVDLEGLMGKLEDIGLSEELLESLLEGLQDVDFSDIALPDNSYDEQAAPMPDSTTYIMDWFDYWDAPLDSEVTVECYVQGTQSWWDGKITVYAEDYFGGYFIYEMACTEEEAAQLVPGTKIRVTGYKTQWEGEIEIVDATFEIIPGDTYITETFDVTAFLGDPYLEEYQNMLVSFDDMTVKEVTFKNGGNDDIYVTLTKNGEDYEFCVEVYLTGPETPVYQTASALKSGDVIDVTGFLYWYQGPNPHITEITFN